MSVHSDGRRSCDPGAGGHRRPPKNQNVIPHPSVAHVCSSILISTNLESYLSIPARGESVHVRFVCSRRRGHDATARNAIKSLNRLRFPLPDLPDGLARRVRVNPLHEKYFAFPETKSDIWSAPSRSHKRGASRSSGTLGAGCDGRFGAVDERGQGGRRNRVVLISRRWDQALRDVAQRDGG